MKRLVLCLAVLLFMSAPVIAGSVTIIVESESFDDRGGWVVDQQFMDEMGSPFLLAHGLGKPVANAKTGKKIMWNGKNLKCTNVPEANNYISKEYRDF